ncbi:MAG: hypothetical protein AAF591_21945 [Verrucomicrobiota bacterium]
MCRFITFAFAFGIATFVHGEDQAARAINGQQLYEVRVEEFRLDDATFTDALREFQRIAKTTGPLFDLGYAYEAIESNRDQRLTVSYRDVSLGEILVLLSAHFHDGLNWILKDNTIIFTRWVQTGDPLRHYIYVYPGDVLNLLDGLEAENGVVDVGERIKEAMLKYGAVPILDPFEPDGIRKIGKSVFDYGFFVEESGVLIIRSTYDFSELFGALVEYKANE